MLVAYIVVLVMHGDTNVEGERMRSNIAMPALTDTYHFFPHVRLRHIQRLKRKLIKISVYFEEKPCISVKGTNVSEELVASIFRIEETSSILLPYVWRQHVNAKY